MLNIKLTPAHQIYENGLYINHTDEGISFTPSELLFYLKEDGDFYLQENGVDLYKLEESI